MNSTVFPHAIGMAEIVAEFQVEGWRCLNKKLKWKSVNPQSYLCC